MIPQPDVGRRCFREDLARGDDRGRTAVESHSAGVEPSQTSSS